MRCGRVVVVSISLVAQVAAVAANVNTSLVSIINTIRPRLCSPPLYVPFSSTVSVSVYTSGAWLLSLSLFSQSTSFLSVLYACVYRCIYTVKNWRSAVLYSYAFKALFQLARKRFVGRFVTIMQSASASFHSLALHSPGVLFFVCLMSVCALE